MIKRFLYIFVPIHKGEWKKFISMGMMFFFILFNYNVLRAVKDGLIVPNIGAEAISFIKMYVITPAALSFMILYTHMSNSMVFDRIFYRIGGFFLIFFLVFALILYPFGDFFHPSVSSVNKLINYEFKFLSTSFKMDHFKWFFKIYEKWTYSLFYIAAELWGSGMIFLGYWQLANNITKTEEAKRMYPMCGFVAHIGSTLGGALVEYSAIGLVGSITIFGYTYQNKFMLLIMLIASLATLAALLIFTYIKNHVVEKEHIVIPNNKKPDNLKAKMGLIESFKIVLSSRYLWLIMMLILCYGISINIIEGVWKYKAKEIYTDTNQFASFTGNVMKWTGICTMVFMIIGAHILRAFGWFIGALITPIMMLVTGLGFFIFVVFSKSIYPYVAHLGFNPLVIAVGLGTIQNIITKGTKYSLFDATKEMTYIPAGEHLRSKGKAAIDVVGARWAKSGGALIQSMLFMIFPAATYDTLAPYLMIMFIALVLLWLFNLKALHKAYEHKLEAHGH